MSTEGRATPGPLRQQAEQRVSERAKADLNPEDLETLSPDARRALLHELRVHQIELEMQNEQLRETQVALDASRAQYFELYDLAPVGYCTVAEDGAIVLANLAASLLLGVPRGALVRQPFPRFVFGGDADLFHLLHQRVLASGGAESCELRMMKADQTPFWVHFAASLSPGPSTNSHMLRVVISDITERKTTEADNQHLEAELRQAQKLELVGRLAGGVAHDFNNMLSVVLMHADAALEGIDPSGPLHDDLVEIQNAARRSAELTRQLLAYARKQIIRPQVLNLEERVDGVVQMLGRIVGPQIHFATRRGPRLWPIKMDSSQVDQVLANLCLNARDAIRDHGTITIETGNCVISEADVAGHVDRVAGDYVRLIVSDTGMGMDSATLAQIFEPFFTTKDIGRGTGLGLATVQGVVTQNRGFIEVSSQPGQGASFRIYLPRFQGDDEPGKVPPLRSVTPRGHETILLVDDDAAVLRITARLLTSLGYAVLATSDVGEALRLARSHVGSIDLLLTDVLMPGLNGVDLAREVLACRPDIKCLFASGFTAEIVARDAGGKEAENFLQKPFSKHHLGLRVRLSLDA